MYADKDHKLKETISLLPEKPGVYLFVDRNGSVIYIGKAKNLKKRAGSYFGKKLDGKTRTMISKTAEIRYFVVGSESDALLLENNLVKEHQPRYNILLKDDKTFPWICIRNENFPRIFLTRTVLRDGSRYFGPYTSVVAVRTLLEMIRQLYPVRTCKLNLSRELIEKGKYRLCLEYHLGKCRGPCEGLQDEEDYQASIDQIRQILKGNIQDVIGMIDRQMKTFAAGYQYEKAEISRQKQDILKRFQAKSTIVNTSIRHVDVFSIVTDERAAFINFIKVMNGAIVQTHSVELLKVLGEDENELLLSGIMHIREHLESTAGETLVPFQPGYSLAETRFVIPAKGDRKKLLDLSERNARYFMLERKKRKMEAKSPAGRKIRVLSTLQADLNMKSTPVHIECFDNSNIHGDFAAAACVVFRNGMPSRKEYRHFNIKTVSGPDDYASTEEVVYRRYKRMLGEGGALPDLVIIDGGKGQLNAAVRSLSKLDLKGKITIIGIAKRLEEIYFPGDKLPMYLNKKSESLKLIQQVRNEAHRFGLRFHRVKRSGSVSRSELEQVKGIGPSSRAILLKTFGSVAEIRKKTEAELSTVVGRARARILLKYFRENK